MSFLEGPYAQEPEIRRNDFVVRLSRPMQAPWLTLACNQSTNSLLVNFFLKSRLYDLYQSDNTNLEQTRLYPVKK